MLFDFPIFHLTARTYMTGGLLSFLLLLLPSLGMAQEPTVGAFAGSTRPVVTHDGFRTWPPPLSFRLRASSEGSLPNGEELTPAISGGSLEAPGRWSYLLYTLTLTVLGLIIAGYFRVRGEPQRAVASGNGSAPLSLREHQPMRRRIEAIAPQSPPTGEYLQGDVLAYLQQVIEGLHCLTHVRNVTIGLVSDHPRLVVDYDPQRLRQIVCNLLTNAVAGSCTGGKVTLHARALPATGGSRGTATLEIIISGPGAGIPQGDLLHLFDRRYRGEYLDGMGAGGSSIGLALTEDLVETLSGTIGVESGAERGVRFTVRLPITNLALLDKRKTFTHSPMPVAAGSTHDPLPPQAGGEAPHPPLRLLIIEDDTDVVNYLTACLQPTYALAFASTGKHGIEKALELLPDLIISNVRMPEKDGYKVTDVLKRDERTGHIPIVLLTARMDVMSRLVGLRRGADAYVTKPFHEEELMVTLANLLAMRQKLRHRYAPAPAPPPPALTDAFLQKVIALVEVHLSDPGYSVPQLSRDLKMSQSTLYRKIKARTDLSPVAFIRRLRLRRGKVLLETGTLTVSEIAYQVGFNSPGYFSDAFLKEFNARPTTVRH